MELNPEIFEVLKEFNIDRSEGVLCLLGYYFELDVEKVCSEETIKQIALTKIVDKDYNLNTIQWGIPLFSGGQTAFDWVKDWTKAFGRINPDREGSWRDATTRMKDFFKKYPEYRKEDIYAARDLYFSSLGIGSRYCMHSHKFIFDGAGAMKKSTLLSYCEKIRDSKSSNNNLQKGRILD